jgi:ribosomal protein L24E
MLLNMPTSVGTQNLFSAFCLRFEYQATETQSSKFRQNNHMRGLATFFVLVSITSMSAAQAFGGRNPGQNQGGIQNGQNQQNMPATSVPEATRMLGDAIKTLGLTLPIYESKNTYAMNLATEAQRALSNNGRYVRIESNKSYQKFLAANRNPQDTNAISRYTPAQRKESEDRITAALSLVSRALKGIQSFKNLKSDRAQAIDLCKETQRQIMECLTTR